MWIRHVFLGLAGLTAGAAVAGGTFAFLIMLNIIPRMIGKTKTAARICLYENMIVLGGIGGNLLSVFLMMRIPLGHIFLGVYGICAGLFVGCSIGGNFKDLPGYLPQNESKSGIVGDSLVYGIGKDSRLTFLFYKTVIRFLK